MANRFEVQVVALDRFTKTFRDLNNRASKAARPLVNVQRQVGALAKELHLDKAAKGLGKVSDAAMTLTRTLGLSLGPLESVLGAGGIAGGLLAAGVAAVGLGVRFAASGFEITRTAQRIGITTDELQRLRGAARLSGVDTDAMTAAVASLGDTLQDAKFGRNPLALQMLNKFGLAIHDNRDGTIDSISTLRELADVLHRTTDPHVQAIIARAFGLEEALPVLRQGGAAVDALGAQAAKLGVVAGPQALQWSVDFTNSLNRMKVAADGVANSYGSKMVPALAQGMDYITGRMTQSSSHPFRAAGGGIFDFLASGPRTLGWAAGKLFGGSAAPTSSDQRTVSGLIGGPLQQGPFARTGAGGLLTGDGGLVGGRYDPAVQAARDREAAAMVRNELQNATNDGDRAALTRELAARNAGAASGTLAPQKVQVEVAFKGAPPGTTATARSTTENAFVPTRIAYSMPGDGP